MILYVDFIYQKWALNKLIFQKQLVYFANNLLSKFEQVSV